MNRRVFKEDGSLDEMTHPGESALYGPDLMTGWALSRRFEKLVCDFVVMADEQGFDLRDVSALMHHHIATPVNFAIMNRRRRAAGEPEYPMPCP